MLFFFAQEKRNGEEKRKRKNRLIGIFDIGNDKIINNILDTWQQKNKKNELQKKNTVSKSGIERKSFFFDGKNWNWVGKNVKIKFVLLSTTKTNRKKSYSGKKKNENSVRKTDWCFKEETVRIFGGVKGKQKTTSIENDMKKPKAIE